VPYFANNRKQLTLNVFLSCSIALTMLLAMHCLAKDPLTQQNGFTQPLQIQSKQLTAKDFPSLHPLPLATLPLVIQHRRHVVATSTPQIQAALDSLPHDNHWALITLGPGVFQEQIFIRRDKTIIQGRGKDTTVVRYAILREHFLQAKRSKMQGKHLSDQQGNAEVNAKPAPNDVLPRGAALEQDWGAAVVNIAASDIVLLDMTVHNSYALAHPTDPKRFTHQFAIRGFQSATRILTDHVNVASNGADTVSLWNKNNGMYYHANGRFSGRVDLMCPRGTAYITRSEFVTLQAVATLWHDGELSPKQKIVVTHSRFFGVNGFELARHHYDGQFYLLHNIFHKALADKPIYRRTYPSEPWRDQPNRFGARYYFYGNQVDGQPNYAWLQDNLAVNHAQQMSADWAFEGAWQPELLLSKIRHAIAD
jgi:pectinesterase